MLTVGALGLMLAATVKLTRLLGLNRILPFAGMPSHKRHPAFKLMLPLRLLRSA
jgi:hypothetical protein